MHGIGYTISNSGKCLALILYASFVYPGHKVKGNSGATFIPAGSAVNLHVSVTPLRSTQITFSQDVQPKPGERGRDKCCAISAGTADANSDRHGADNHI